MKAQCTWGDGPDIVLSLEGTSLVLLENPSKFNHFKRGVVSAGSADLTVSEAKQLCYELACAIQECEQLDKMYADTLAHTVPYRLSKEEEAAEENCLDKQP